MDSDWSSDYSDASLPPPKYGPDTRPPEGHELAIPFLYTPLPDELPTGVHMDLLLLYAAYVGNIDRYVWHRDPNHFIKHEFDSVTIPMAGGEKLDAAGNISVIRHAIHARYIMNNDLSHIDQEADEDCLPYLIWYPHIADSETYEELARRKPAIKAQAVRACMVAGYKDAYDRINPTPDWFLVEQAERLANTTPYYLEDLQRRAEQIGIDLTEDPDIDERWKIIEDQFLGRGRAFIISYRAEPEQTVDESEWMENYNGYGVDLSRLELYAGASDEIKKQSNGDQLNLRLMYAKASRTGGST